MRWENEREKRKSLHFSSSPVSFPFSARTSVRTKLGGSSYARVLAAKERNPTKYFAILDPHSACFCYFYAFWKSLDCEIFGRVRGISLRQATHLLLLLLPLVSSFYSHATHPPTTSARQTKLKKKKSKNLARSWTFIATHIFFMQNKSSKII